MKKNRRRKLIDIIKNKKIFTQDELTDELVKAGCIVTQATVSRDIRELGIIKISDETGKTYYSIRENSSIVIDMEHDKSILSSCILEIDFAQNLVVIKTKSGAAMVVATAIDNLKDEGVLGCIAGDDTIFLAVRDSKNAERISYYLSDIIG